VFAGISLSLIRTEDIIQLIQLSKEKEIFGWIPTQLETTDNYQITKVEDDEPYTYSTNGKITSLLPKSKIITKYYIHYAGWSRLLELNTDIIDATQSTGILKLDNNTLLQITIIKTTLGH